MNYKIINPATGADLVFTNDRISEFLYEHLDQYGDPKTDILSCISYALSTKEGYGGMIILAIDEEEIAGAAVLNETGMGGYIPENILVYIAVDKKYRGQGVGKELMKQAQRMTRGDIALHVEADNPAKFLYEKVGFTNPYLEMRWKRN